MSKEPPPNLEINKEASELIKKQTEEFLAKDPDNKIEQLGRAKTVTEVKTTMEKNARNDGVSPEKKSEARRKIEFKRRQWNKAKK